MRPAAVAARLITGACIAIAWFPRLASAHDPTVTLSVAWHAGSADRAGVRVLAQRLDRPAAEVRRDGARIGAGLLEVSLSPPTPPDGIAWTVSLARADTSPTRTTVSESASSAGEARFQLSPGEYRLAVLADGQQWFGDSLDVAEAPRPVHIELPLVAVQGRVRLGGRPLAARLRLLHPQGRSELLFESDWTGAFEGHLPGPGRWDAEIEYGDPPLSRSLPGLLVAPSSDGPATLDIELPATLLRGQVVTGDGRPLPGAGVRVQPVQAGAAQSHTQSDDAGRFDLSGLPPGELLLMAEMRDLRSDETRVVLEEGDAPTGEVRLVARPTARLQGEVVGDAGRPLPGAWVRASATDRPLTIDAAGRGETDADGRFDLPLPPGTRAAWAFAGAPGYALRLLSSPVPAPPGFRVPLSRASGRLAVRFDQPWDWVQRPLVLEHRGARESVLLLFSFWALPNGVVWDPRRLVIPALEPGPCRVCSLTPDAYRAGAPATDCVEGVVPPGGALELAAPR